MVSTAFSPLCVAAAAMYQQREHPMQPYQQHVQMDYGNRARGGAAYPLFPATGVGPDPFYSTTDANGFPPTPFYGYGQPQQQSLTISPFSISPTSIATSRCELPVQHESNSRAPPSVATIKDCNGYGQQVVNSTASDASNGAKGDVAFLPAAQQPSAIASSQCTSFAPCRMFSPSFREAEMEPDVRRSPSYLYGTGRSSYAQSCYAVTPPTTGFYFPGTSAQQTAPFATGHFGDNSPMASLGPEYPWMKGKNQCGQAACGPNLTSPADSAMEIGRWCSPNAGRTRTREKYRMVYTDGQRLELEKEFITSEYISTQRKTFLSRTLGLSERQIKIWFQNRRAKKRKQARRTTAVSEGSTAVSHPPLRQMPASMPDFRTLTEEVKRPHSLQAVSGSPNVFL